MSINGKVSLSFRINEILDSPENVIANPQTALIEDTYTIDDGTGSDQADLLFSDRRSVVASATDTLDLGTGGGLTDVFNVSIVPFVKVTVIVIRNRSTTAGDILHIGPHTVNGFIGPWVATGDLNEVGPGDVVYLRNDAGWTVTDGSVDTIRVVEVGGANTVIYDIGILGRSS